MDLKHTHEPLTDPSNTLEQLLTELCIQQALLPSLSASGEEHLEHKRDVQMQAECLKNIMAIRAEILRRFEEKENLLAIAKIVMDDQAKALGPVEELLKSMCSR